jgi:hypothetical protein
MRLCLWIILGLNTLALCTWAQEPGLTNTGSPALTRPFLSRIRGLFDIELPQLDPPGTVKFILYPHISDLVRRDYVRTDVGFRWTLNDHFEFSTEGAAFIAHGFGQQATGSGIGELRYGLKYLIHEWLPPDFEASANLSVTQPLTILSALPPSAAGAVVSLLIGGYGLAINSLIGMLMLMGIVTKNSILLVEYAIMAQRDHGMSRLDAVLDSCSKRARPIVMTSIAMSAGMLPVAMGWAGDPSFRAPIGVAVMGGLIVSTVVSLFIVPVIYTIMDDMQFSVGARVGKLMGHKPAAPEVPVAPQHS